MHKIMNIFDTIEHAIKMVKEFPGGLVVKKLVLSLLWLWRRPVATAPIQPLAWEPPYAAGVAQEIAKTTTTTKKKTKRPKKIN